MLETSPTESTDDSTSSRHPHIPQDPTIVSPGNKSIAKLIQLMDQSPSFGGPEAKFPRNILPTLLRSRYRQHIGEGYRDTISTDCYSPHEQSNDTGPHAVRDRTPRKWLTDKPIPINSCWINADKQSDEAEPLTGDSNGWNNFDGSSCIHTTDMFGTGVTEADTTGLSQDHRTGHALDPHAVPGDAKETHEAVIHSTPPSTSLFADIPAIVSQLPDNKRTQQLASPSRRSRVKRVQTTAPKREAGPSHKQTQSTVESITSPSNIGGQCNIKWGKKRQTPPPLLSSRRPLQPLSSGYGGRRQLGVGNRLQSVRHLLPLLKQRPSHAHPTKSSCRGRIVSHRETTSLREPLWKRIKYYARTAPADIRFLCNYTKNE
ncbi:hypothetical protein TGMAS_219110 [Toxoplasma gondii MAS]|uniref:Uncharacterized protein n=1 Tax=Toxoplasma gondii MAS TaxID=943118 RepID=A0A086QT08_TOXGO|nr:hypothetical protein TGMAS_219110 [Toxoplasma gondii MAS]